jgi:hypothetical protein
MNPTEVDCTTACVNGCVLGDECPKQEYRDKAAQFIQETSLDQMLAIAEAARIKKATAPPQWVFPEDGVPKGN